MTIQLSDDDYNRLMDEIVVGTSGDVSAVIHEITSLGLHLHGVGMCPMTYDEKGRKIAKN